MAKDARAGMPLERARDVANLLQQRSRPLIPLANHPLALLACEEWSPIWAERKLNRLRELAKPVQSATNATLDPGAWLGCLGSPYPEPTWLIGLPW